MTALGQCPNDSVMRDLVLNYPQQVERKRGVDKIHGGARVAAFLAVVPVALCCHFPQGSLALDDSER